VSRLLYLTAVRGDCRQQDHCQAGLDIGPSAWELDRHVSVTGGEVTRHNRLSVSDREVLVLPSHRTPSILVTELNLLSSLGVTGVSGCRGSLSEGTHV